METINLNKKVASIEVQEDKIIINLEEERYIPKEGEYFYLKCTYGKEFIAIKKEGKYITTRYGSYRINGGILFISEDDGYVCTDNQIAEIRPATEDERILLDKALHEKGKKWNPETMQIETLTKVGDFCIFWNDDKSLARCGVLSEIDPTREFPYQINYGIYFGNCILFQSTEYFKEFIKNNRNSN